MMIALQAHRPPTRAAANRPCAMVKFWRWSSPEPPDRADGSYSTSPIPRRLRVAMSTTSRSVTRSDHGVSPAPQAAIPPDDMAADGEFGCVEAIIEIPKGTRNKYEYDHERHVIFLDRRLFSATFYPADYGFVPDTLAEDGDPLDVLVLIDEATFPGCHIMVRPIGLFLMTDEHGPDAKIIAVPAADPNVGMVHDLDDLPASMTAEIAHFFEVYKDLEPGKRSEVAGFAGPTEAWEEIKRSRERARQSATPGDNVRSESTCE